MYAFVENGRDRFFDLFKLIEYFIQMLKFPCR
jgi:hypothetical protein